MTATGLVLHRVRDYDAWRKVYDDVGPLQREGGVIAESVHRLATDANTVLVQHRFDSMERAQAFFENPGLRAAMERAGVEGAPRIECFEDV